MLATLSRGTASLVVEKEVRTVTKKKKNVFLILEVIMAGAKLGSENHLHLFLVVAP